VVWRIAPVLGCDDVHRVAEWFRDTLGFSLAPTSVFRLDPDGPVTYAIVERDDVGVHLQLSPDGTPRSITDDNAYDAYVQVPRADALHDEFVARGVTVVQPLEDQPYGMRDFSVESPEGHRLLFGSPRT